MEKQYPRLLAIDPATKCGYAYVDILNGAHNTIKPVRHQAGYWDLSKDRFQSYGMRFLRFEKALYEVDPDFVIFEEVTFQHRSTAAAQMYFGCTATLQSFCEKHGIQYATVLVPDVKRRATGKGNAKKEAMIDAANDFFEIDPPLKHSSALGHDNIADAMWICQLGIELYSSVITLRDSSRKPYELKRTGMLDDDSVKKPKAKKKKKKENEEPDNDFKDFNW